MKKITLTDEVGNSMAFSPESRFAVLRTAKGDYVLSFFVDVPRKDVDEGNLAMIWYRVEVAFNYQPESAAWYAMRQALKYETSDLLRELTLKN